MKELQTIIKKHCINDVQESEDGQLIWIELNSCELSLEEKNTLVSINLKQNLLGLDVFAKLHERGIVNNVGRSSAGNWCIEIAKSGLSDEELDELKEYVSQNRPIGNTEENRNRVAKQMPAQKVTKK